MKFDRNTVLGFVVMGLLLVGYFWTTSKEQAAYRKKQEAEQAIKDSIAKANQPKIDSASLKANAAKLDSTIKKEKGGKFQANATAPDTTFELDNDLMKVTFASRGGQPKKIELKKFRRADSSDVKLASTDFDKIDYSINTLNNSSAYISELNFTLDTIVKNPDGSSFISMSIKQDSGTAYVKHEFTLRKGDYMVDFNIKMGDAERLLPREGMNLNWQYRAVQQELSISFEKQNTQVGYVVDGDFDYHTIGRTSGKEFNGQVNWVGIRQRFFNTILVAKNGFAPGSKINWTIPADTTGIIVESVANMNVKVPAGNTVSIPFSIFYGPADYKTLTKYDLKFGKIINLGQGPYAFVRPINKYIVMPAFDFIKSFAGSLGLAIAILTILIRLLISPLTYTSYLSGAKMKVLRPEIAKLREKYGSDQQQISVEQMKLFREAGVNPLGGCIPALLQIPIFFALYSFFNASVDLRGQSFLWAKDLSAPDAVIHLGNIPVIGSLLGDHISLFTLTAVATSFLISIYSMSLSPDQSNPVMKYMPYIFPIFLLFIFNRLPSALTWYYTVSNIITLALQFVIQNYIIDHDKILAKIEENRKKPKTKSKWQERMEQMQEQQKKMKDAQKSKR